MSVVFYILVWFSLDTVNHFFWWNTVDMQQSYPIVCTVIFTFASFNRSKQVLIVIKRLVVMMSKYLHYCKLIIDSVAHLAMKCLGIGPELLLLVKWMWKFQVARTGNCFQRINSVNNRWCFIRCEHSDLGWAT